LATGLLRVLLPVAVIGVGVALAVWFMETGPKATPRPPARNAALVEVTEVQYGPQRALIEAMGTVAAAREIELRPLVSGEVLGVSPAFIPGGLFKTGDMLLKIDPADYELIVQQLATDVAKAEADERMESGSQAIARREYELLGEALEEEDLDLVLRRPQLETVRASLESARARLEKARLDLERTVIKAPFNAIVKSREVNIGSHVSETIPLATLIGTDEYWVEVSIPVNQLQWVQIPGGEIVEGALVRVYDQAAWGNGVYREGRVIRLAAGLEEQGRMARLLISVRDPLGLDAEEGGTPRLLIGSYVRVEIEGVEFESVMPVSRALIRDGDRVWIMNGEDRLDIRPVEVAFRGRDRVLIADGIEPHERLVVTDLATPVQDMPLRMQESRGAKGENSDMRVDAEMETKP
jgi:RND family efflux transporter MFP subunit